MLSMNNVYLDVLFLINFFTDYITLICTAKLCHAIIRRHLIICASLIGGIYACLCTIYHSHWINTPFMYLTYAILLCLISFYKEDQLIRCSISFLIISAIFGGLLSPFVFVTKQGMLLPINIKALIITFAAVYFILSQLYRQAFSKVTQIHQKAEITFRNKTIAFSVLQDTGNELYDPISNIPVLIIEKKLAAELISDLKEESDSEDIYSTFCRLNSIPSLMGKFRIIPYQSLSGKDILLGFTPDKILINGKKKEMIVAYTDLKLSTNNQYQGIC